MAQPVTRNITLTFGTALTVAGLGALMVAISGAATFSAGTEAEAGNRNGNLAVSADSNASGGSAVRFGSGSVGGSISCDQAGVQKLVASVSAASIETNLRRLTQDDTKPTPNQSISRHVSSPGNKQKTDWMKAELTGYGLTDVSQNFTSGSFSLVNPVGRLTGNVTPNTVYAIGGHIDSISENAKTLAPGAEDDGTGTVITMEAGRVLAQFKPCLKSTVEFIGFNDEEENMKGSATYVNSVKTGSGKTFKGVLNMDMVGYAPNGECMVANANPNIAADQPMVDKVVQMNTKYGIGLNLKTGTYSTDDIDNSSFWDAKLPSVYLDDCPSDEDADNYPNYHSTGDIVSSTNINFPQMEKLAKVMVAALAEYGMQ